jgi:monoamine oxidase
VEEDLIQFGSEPPAPNYLYTGAGQWLAQPPRIAVIGGGPGGLFATYILNQKFPQAEVTLFESGDRLGGKIRTVRFEDGTPFEAGVAELYEYLGPGGKDPLRQLIEEDLGLETNDMAGGCVVLGEKIIRDHDEFEQYFGAEARKCLEDFHRKMAELMPLEKYANRWQPDNEHPWASETFRDLLLEETKDHPEVRRYVLAAIHSDLATEAHTCNGLNAIKNALMDNDAYMQLYHIEGGIERLPLALSRRIKADVRLGYRVCALSTVRSLGGYYEVEWESGGAYNSAVFNGVVVAVPNHWLGQICWCCEPLEGKLQHTLEHYDLPAHYLRVSMNFSERWWTRLQIPGEFWMMDVYNGCCVYDEERRWGEGPGHVLSFLIAGGDALLNCAHGQSDECIVKELLRRLPSFMRCAEDYLIEAQVDRFAGSINAQPGGWPAEELEGEHYPDPEGHPRLVIVGDYLFDSTLNAALISANTAANLILKEFGIEPEPKTPAVAQLEPDGATL